MGREPLSLIISERLGEFLQTTVCLRTLESSDLFPLLFFKLF